MEKPTNFKHFRKFKKSTNIETKVRNKLVADLVSKIAASNLILISWSYSGKSINSLMHALFGNKKIGYRVAAWNCRRGLLNPDGSQSHKITDIQLYLHKHQLHIFGIIESDLHGPNSRVRRRNPLSTKDVHEKLHIDGYYILLPQSWHSHDQARVIVYVKDGGETQRKKTGY